MNWAQAIDGEWIAAGRPNRLGTRHRPADSAWQPGEIYRRRDGGSKKESIILAALRGNPMTISELHGEIGGSFGSLSVYLSKMRIAGMLKTTGDRGRFRYVVPT